MYRKHLREMDSTTAATTTANAHKTGFKTIDKVAKIPVVNSLITNVNDGYEKIKDRNAFLRTSFTISEMSLRTVAWAATPITAMCKKPIETVDGYLCDAIDFIEYKYPVITKPADQLTASAYTQVKGIYDKTLKQPIDTIYNIKNSSIKTVTDMKSYGTNKVQNSLCSLRSYSYAQIVNTAGYGIRIIDACLEQKYAKMLTTPFLDLTEKSINYLLPASSATPTNVLPNGSNDNDDDDDELIEVENNNNNQFRTLDETHTLRRLYDINNRVIRHAYHTTYIQLTKLNFQFDNLLKKLNLLKQFREKIYENSKTTITNSVETSKNSLKSICAKYVDLDNLPLAKLETLCRNYYTAILYDVNNMLHHYADVLKTLPIFSNGTKLKQTATDLLGKLSTEPLSVLLKGTIDHLTTLHASLMSFIQQVFHSQQSSNNTSTLANNNSRGFSFIDSKKNY